LEDISVAARGFFTLLCLDLYDDKREWLETMSI